MRYRSPTQFSVTAADQRSVSFSPTLMLSSLVIALAFALGVYRSLGMKPRYSNLISGNLAWNDTAKARDYATAICGVLVAVLMYRILDGLSEYARNRGGIGMQRGLHNVLLLSLAPVCLTVALVFYKDAHDRTLLHLSTLLIFCTAVFGLRITKRGWKIASIAKMNDVLGSLVAMVPLSAMSGFGLAICTARVIDPHIIRSTTTVWGMIGIASALGFIAAIYITQGNRDDEPIHIPGKRLSLGLIGVQLGVPLLFCSLIPIRTLDPDVWWYGEVLSINFWVLLWLLVGAAYLDLARRTRMILRGDQRSASWAISPICLLAIVTTICIAPMGPPRVLDDYHWGEFVVPFWSLTEFGTLPYVDYTPARGLINYLPGLFANVFGDGTAGSFTTTGQLVALMYYAIALSLLVRFFGRGIGFILAMMVVYNLVAEIQVFVACMLLIMSWGVWHWRPTTWLVWWVVMGTTLVLLAPGQGGLSVLATMPLGAYCMIRALRDEPGKLLKTSSISLVAGLGVLFFTPLGPMILGAVRYGLEQSSVNTLAHAISWDLESDLGIPWKNGRVRMPLPHGAFEMMRTAFLLVAAASGIVCWKYFRSGRGVRKTLAVSFGLCAMIYLSLMTMRALGRVDVGTPSRPILATLFAMVFVFPLLARYAANSSRQIPVIVSMLPVGFLVVIATGSRLRPLDSISELAMIYQHPVELLDGKIDEKNGLDAPNIGRITINEKHANTVHSLSIALNEVLQDGEGYIDLTNRSAMHFYLDRPPALNTTAIYNTVQHDQQLRAVRHMAAQSIAAALASPQHGINFDGGSPAIRSPFVWRYVVQRFMPLLIDNWYIFIDQDRVDEYEGDGKRASGEIDRRAMLEKAFPIRSLARLPRAWGRSIKTLEGKVFDVVSTNDIHIIAGLEPVQDQVGVWKTRSAPVILEIDLGESGILGKEAGLLLLHLNYPRGIEPKAEIGWSSDTGRDHVEPQNAEYTRLRCFLDSGDHIIPLDSSPDWLLGHSGRITVRIDGFPPGVEIRDLTARLGQRRGVEEIDRLAGDQ